MKKIYLWKADGAGVVFGMGAFWQSYLLEKDGQCPFCWELQSIIITAARQRCQFILRCCQRSNFHKMHQLLILQRLSPVTGKWSQLQRFNRLCDTDKLAWAFFTLEHVVFEHWRAILQSWEKSMQDWFHHWETPIFGPDSSPRSSGPVWWFSQSKNHERNSQVWFD